MYPPGNNPIFCCLVLESVIRCVQMPKKTRAVSRLPLSDQLLPAVSGKLPVLQESLYSRFLRKTTESRMDATRNRLSKVL